MKFKSYKSGKIDVEDMDVVVMLSWKVHFSAKNIENAFIALWDIWIKWYHLVGFEPTIIQGKHLYGRSYNMAINLKIR